MTSLDDNLPGRWRLQDAKARFSELVRRARSDGPQHVTVRGRDEVVVVAAEEFYRLKGDRSGAALVKVMQDSRIARSILNLGASGHPYAM